MFLTAFTICINIAMVFKPFIFKLNTETLFKVAGKNDWLKAHRWKFSIENIDRRLNLGSWYVMGSCKLAMKPKGKEPPNEGTLPPNG